jgi:hypothetical protein
VLRTDNCLAYIRAIMEYSFISFLHSSEILMQ